MSVEPNCLAIELVTVLDASNCFLPTFSVGYSALAVAAADWIVVDIAKHFGRCRVGITCEVVYWEPANGCNLATIGG